MLAMLALKACLNGIKTKANRPVLNYIRREHTYGTVYQQFGGGSGRLGLAVGFYAICDF